MIPCPHCGSQHPEAAKFCPKTGKPVVQETLYCDQCGRALRPGYKFCPGCGKATAVRAGDRPATARTGEAGTVQRQSPPPPVSFESRQITGTPPPPPVRLEQPAPVQSTGTLTIGGGIPRNRLLLYILVGLLIVATVAALAFTIWDILRPATNPPPAGQSTPLPAGATSPAESATPGLPQDTATPTEIPYPGPAVQPPAATQSAPPADTGPTTYPGPAAPPGAANPTQNPEPTSNAQPESTPTQATPYPGSDTLTSKPGDTSLPAASLTSQAITITLPTTTTATSGSVELQPSDPAKFRQSSGKVQVVMFYAPWCGACQALAPVVTGLEADYANKVNFIYLDTDDPATKSIQQALGFKVEPHLFLLDSQGKILGQWQRYVSKQDLQTALDNILK